MKYFDLIYVNQIKYLGIKRPSSSALELEEPAHKKVMEANGTLTEQVWSLAKIKIYTFFEWGEGGISNHLNAFYV